jgi:hypothetical protein
MEVHGGGVEWGDSPSEGWSNSMLLFDQPSLLFDQPSLFKLLFDQPLPVKIAPWLADK